MVKLCPNIIVVLEGELMVIVGIGGVVAACTGIDMKADINKHITKKDSILLIINDPP